MQRSVVPTIIHTPNFSFDARPILRVNIVLVNKVPNIVSGGQTRADRAALDFTIERGIRHGGWCPKGRRLEDGPIEPKYQLKETPSAENIQRTEWNARDADGTVVFLVEETLTGGSKQTIEFARKHGKPMLHLSRNGGPASPELALSASSKTTASRCSTSPGQEHRRSRGVGAFVKEVLGKTWPSP